MIWKDELEAIDQLSKRVANFGADIARQITQFESRRDTLQNELNRLEADYEVICSRNEMAKKDFQKSIALDMQQLQEGKRRVNEREVQLIEKEKELRKLKAELETEIASIKSSKQTVEAIGRNYAKK